MKKEIYVIFLTITIGGTYFLLFHKSRNEKYIFREQYRNYVSAPGKITNKHQRVGPKARINTTYSVLFITKDGKEYKQTSNNVGNGLANSYEAGDTLTVYYNPLDPNDPIMDRSGIEAGSNVLNYNNVVPYAIGLLVTGIALFYYGRKDIRSGQ